MCVVHSALCAAALQVLQKAEYFVMPATGLIQLSARAIAISATWFNPRQAKDVMDLGKRVVLPATAFAYAE